MFTFNMQAVANRQMHPELNDLLNQNVDTLWVDFLQDVDFNSYVMVRLMTQDVFNTRDERNRPLQIYGCQLSVNIKEGSISDGEMGITLLLHDNSSHQAVISFQYPLLRSIKISDILFALQGTAKNLAASLQSDLTQFGFVAVDTRTEPMAASRDVV